MPLRCFKLFSTDNITTNKPNWGSIASFIQLQFKRAREPTAPLHATIGNNGISDYDHEKKEFLPSECLQLNGHANALFVFIVAAFKHYAHATDNDMTGWNKACRSILVTIRNPMSRRHTLKFDLGTKHETHEVGMILQVLAVDQCDAVAELAKEIKANRSQQSSKPATAEGINDEFEDGPFKSERLVQCLQKVGKELLQWSEIRSALTRLEFRHGRQALSNSVYKLEVLVSHVPQTFRFMIPQIIDYISIMLAHDGIKGGIAGLSVSYLTGTTSKKKKDEEDKKDDEKCAEVGLVVLLLTRLRLSGWLMDNFPEVSPQLKALFGHIAAYEQYLASSSQTDDLAWLATCPAHEQSWKKSHVKLLDGGLDKYIKLAYRVCKSFEPAQLVEGHSVLKELKAELDQACDNSRNKKRQLSAETSQIDASESSNGSLKRLRVDVALDDEEELSLDKAAMKTASEVRSETCSIITCGLNASKKDVVDAVQRAPLYANFKGEWKTSTRVIVVDANHLAAGAKAWKIAPSPSTFGKNKIEHGANAGLELLKSSDVLLVFCGYKEANRSQMQSITQNLPSQKFQVKELFLTYALKQHKLGQKKTMN